MDQPTAGSSQATTIDRALTVEAQAPSAARAARAATHSALVVPLFASAMFLSAFLLFLVEPMIAKMVLPILGGSPMVWNACVVFFQITLLAGYGYAYAASTWLTPRRHILLHAALLLVPAAVLPVTIQAGTVTPPAGNPVGWLLLLLAGSVGLPFFVLSTSASVFQHWLSKTDHPAAGDPYFLYAASNLGSLLALACYPIGIEPVFTLREQARLWTTGYAEFVALAAACAAFTWWRADAGSRRAAVADLTADAAAPPMTARRRARWIALAFIPSSLMLAVTSHISTDIAAVPLLWIVPLAIYLLTFVLAFGRHTAAVRDVAGRAFPLLVVPLALFMTAKVRAPISVIIPLHLLAFAAAALQCHAEIAHDRPASARLTEFYFCVSFGGMLGGLFNTLAAPMLFNSIAEYPLVVVLACALLPATAARARGAVGNILVPVIVAVMTSAVFLILQARSAPFAWQVTALALPAVLVFTQRKSMRFGYSMAAFLLAGLAFGNAGERVLYATRTFFGVYRVSEDLGSLYHGLVNGTTLHGMQALAPARRHEALTYFHETGPFGQAFKALPRAAAGHEIGVVGLGVGTLGTYARPDQRWTFFEIDPAIERIARTNAYFSYMEACGDRCRVVLGDARLSLNRVRGSTYDLLVIDAFSSDSIPMHLMTREAVSLYLSRIVPGGALVMHISNRHLLLGPVVARLAASQGLLALQQVERRKPDWPEAKRESHWVVMARNRADLGSLPSDPRWSPLVPSASTALWTDDFSNILSVLSVR